MTPPASSTRSSTESIESKQPQTEQPLSEKASEATVFGYCHPDYQKVYQAFEDNLKYRNEIGACVSVVVEGETVVDLWGGFKDEQHTHPWEEDTLVCVMSVTKAIASLAVIQLADQGSIDLDKPVAHYWPEFAQNGKEDITVRCVLAQLAGLPVADAAPAGSLYEHGVIERALEIQEPLWPPWSTPCYHSFTHGPLCQELVVRCTGKSLGQYFRQDMLGPLGIELYLGMTQDEVARCADITMSNGIPTVDRMKDPDTLLSRAWRPLPTVENMFTDNRFRTAEFASGNGHSNARNLAKLYGLLAMEGDQDEQGNTHRIISKAMLEDVIEEQWDNVEVMTHRHFRFGTGFMLNNPYFKLGGNPRSFGHPGLGGANAFGDPDAKLGFGYCCNRVHAIDETGPCATALINAAYESLEARKTDDG
jgi:CubicO group peptidase (beta-lactamase class C family)